MTSHAGRCRKSPKKNQRMEIGLKTVMGERG